MKKRRQDNDNNYSDRYEIMRIFLVLFLGLSIIPVFTAGLWIVYNYEDTKDQEKIYIWITQSTNSFTQKTIFEHNDIQKEKQDWQDIKDGKVGL